MSAKLELWEILVPTRYGDTEKPIRTRHHLNWDKRVIEIAGGLTLLKPASGKWVEKHSGRQLDEKVIPVRIACTAEQAEEIINFTLVHYRQLAVMAYKLSDTVVLKHKEDE